jgi:hypothetical protein
MRPAVLPMRSRFDKLMETGVADASPVHGVRLLNMDVARRRA